MYASKYRVLLLGPHTTIDCGAAGRGAGSTRCGARRRGGGALSTFGLAHAAQRSSLNSRLVSSVGASEGATTTRVALVCRVLCCVVLCCAGRGMGADYIATVSLK